MSIEAAEGGVAGGDAETQYPSRVQITRVGRIVEVSIIAEEGGATGGHAETQYQSRVQIKRMSSNLWRSIGGNTEPKYPSTVMSTIVGE